MCPHVSRPCVSPSRIKELCQQLPHGITDQVIQNDMPHLEPQQRAMVINKLLSLVSDLCPGWIPTNVLLKVPHCVRGSGVDSSCLMKERSLDASSLGSFSSRAVKRDVRTFALKKDRYLNIWLRFRRVNNRTN